MQCNNDSSSKKHVSIGVPQRSVLGPILFLIYANDIHDYPLSAKCNLYADDALIYCTGQSYLQVNGKLQHSVKAVKFWYDANHLVINT